MSAPNRKPKAAPLPFLTFALCACATAGPDAATLDASQEASSSSETDASAPRAHMDAGHTLFDAGTRPVTSETDANTMIPLDGSADPVADADANTSSAPKLPNIVVILNDDQGWNGTSHSMMAARPDSKSDFYETPSIAQLASLGMTFSNGYAAPNCSPSRLSLLTGKTPARLKMTDIIGRVSGEDYEGHLLLPPGQARNPAQRIPEIPDSEQTIAELIKSRHPNYATAHFGKWHLAGGGPAKHGFDVSDGATGNADGDVGGDDPKQVFSMAEKARKFVRTQVADGHPFYLQLSYYATHAPDFALASTLAKYQAKTKGLVHTRPLFAAMTENLDTSIGQVLSTLLDPNGDGDDADSLLPNTYVVLLADNGAVKTESDNLPLAFGKATTWEGGVRVPFMIAGPHIQAGSRSDVPVTEYDLLPTIAAWLDATPAPHGGVLDGASLASVVKGQATKVERRNAPLVFHFPHYQVEKGSTPMSSIRDGNMKLVHFYETGESHLFNLANDLGEQHDLAANQVVTVRTLRRKLRDSLKDASAPMPRLNPKLGKGALPDVDQDGLDDDWEFRELLTTSYSGSDDPDGDGQDNATELANQTDPL